MFGHRFDDGQFVPFKMQGYKEAAGQLVTIDEQLQLFTPGLSAAKQKRNSVWLINSGVVQIELEPEEATAITTGVVAVHVRPQGDSGVGEERLRENSDGYYINVDCAAARMEPNKKASVALTVYQFGQPQSTHPQIEFKAETSEPAPSSAVKLELSDDASPAPGRFPLQLSTGDAFALPSKRQPMDSQLCAIKATSGSTFIGEGLRVPTLPPLPLLSLLFWQNHKVVQQANWQDHIEPILANYGRLYPGMKGRLDLTNEETVTAFAKLFKDRFLVDVQDPAFMPVVRDMSPSTIHMIVDWLDGQANV